MKKIDKIIRWVWQSPQNIVGSIVKLFSKDLNVLGGCRTCSKDGKPIDIYFYLNTDIRVYLWNKNSGVSLGKYVFVPNYFFTSKTMLQHELGHCKQSLLLGPVYLFVVGIPSLVHALLYKSVCKDRNYYHFYTEKWADKLVGIKR